MDECVMHGKPISNEQIQAWADEAEAGYDLPALPAARRVSGEDVVDAAHHVLSSHPLDDEDDPRRWLMIGLDPAGRALELVLLIFDDGSTLVIHAMKARRQYLDAFR